MGMPVIELFPKRKKGICGRVLMIMGSEDHKKKFCRAFSRK